MPRDSGVGRRRSFAQYVTSPVFRAAVYVSLIICVIFIIALSVTAGMLLTSMISPNIAMLALGVVCLVGLAIALLCLCCISLCKWKLRKQEQTFEVHARLDTPVMKGRGSWYLDPATGELTGRGRKIPSTDYQMYAGPTDDSSPNVLFLLRGTGLTDFCECCKVFFGNGRYPISFRERSDGKIIISASIGDLDHDDFFKLMACQAKLGNKAMLTTWLQEVGERYGPWLMEMENKDVDWSHLPLGFASLLKDFKGSGISGAWRGWVPRGGKSEMLLSRLQELCDGVPGDILQYARRGSSEQERCDAVMLWCVDAFLSETSVVDMAGRRQRKAGIMLHSGPNGHIGAEIFCAVSGGRKLKGRWKDIKLNVEGGSSSVQLDNIGDTGSVSGVGHSSKVGR